MLYWKIQLQVSVHLFISPHTGETGGGALGFLVVCHFVRPPVCLSVRPSVRPSVSVSVHLVFLTFLICPLTY